MSDHGRAYNDGAKFVLEGAYAPDGPWHIISQDFASEGQPLVLDTKMWDYTLYRFRPSEVAREEGLSLPGELYPTSFRFTIPITTPIPNAESITSPYDLIGALDFSEAPSIKPAGNRGSRLQTGGFDSMNEQETLRFMAWCRAQGIGGEVGSYFVWLDGLPGFRVYDSAGGHHWNVESDYGYSDWRMYARFDIALLWQEERERLEARTWHESPGMAGRM